MRNKKIFQKYTNATKFDDWLVKVCGLNEAGYLLPRWKRVKVAIQSKLFWR